MYKNADVQELGVRVQNSSYPYFQTQCLPVQQLTLPLIDGDFIQGDVNRLENLYLGFWYLLSLTQ